MSDHEMSDHENTRVAPTMLPRTSAIGQPPSSLPALHVKIAPSDKWGQDMEWESLDIANSFNPGIMASGNSETSFHIVISDDEILTIDGVHPWRPLNQDEWRWSGLDAIAEHYLGESYGTPIFATEVDPDIDNPPGFEFETLWTFLGSVDESTFSLIGRARQIVEWHRNHQYCGQCGKSTDTSTNDRSRICHDCKQTFYPRLSPSIIVLVTKGEEILLARNAHSPDRYYSTLAGFIEPGESIEDAVHREVFEEVGIHVKNLNYYNSQSWPFPNALMLGFHAEYHSGEIVLQEEEIADAKWFHHTNLPNRPTMVSISGWLINDHIKRLTNQA